MNLWLTVGVVDWPHGSWILMTLPWLLNAGIGMLFVVIFLSRPSVPSLYWPVIIAWAACAVPAGLAIAYRKHFLRRSSGTRITLIILSWIANIAVFTYGALVLIR